MLLSRLLQLAVVAALVGMCSAAEVAERLIATLEGRLSTGARGGTMASPP